MRLHRGAGPRTARHLLANAAVALLAACSPPPPAPPPLAHAESQVAVAQRQEDRERFIASVLTRTGPSELKGLRISGEGTGFYVATNKVLTNFHVAGRCTAITVGNGTEGKEAVAHLIAGDEQNDLALLGVEVAGEPAPFETELRAERGLDIAIMGYPAHGLAVRLAELTPATAEQRDLFADRATYPFHGEVHPGNSGSPVLDDSGAVIGVVVRKIDTVAVYQHTGRVVEDIGIAIANRVVLPFLAANHVAVRPAEPVPPMTHERVLETAHGFVRQIGCWH